jgi:hypothetical protein
MMSGDSMAPNRVSDAPPERLVTGYGELARAFQQTHIHGCVAYRSQPVRIAPFLWVQLRPAICYWPCDRCVSADTIRIAHATQGTPELIAHGCCIEVRDQTLATAPCMSLPRCSQNHIRTLLVDVLLLSTTAVVAAVGDARVFARWETVLPHVAAHRAPQSPSRCVGE